MSSPPKHSMYVYAGHLRAKLTRASSWPRQKIAALEGWPRPGAQCRALPYKCALAKRLLNSVGGSVLSVNACARGGRSYVVVHVLQVYYVLVESLARARPRVVSYIYACRPMPEVTRAPEGGVQASNSPPQTIVETLTVTAALSDCMRLLP